MVNSLVILAIVVLPGWISMSVSQRYYPRIVDRSTVMTWGLLFYHAAIVHVLGSILFAVVLVALCVTGLYSFQVDQILSQGIADYTKESPTPVFVVSGLYVLWLLLGSTISGVVGLPWKSTDLVGAALTKMKLAPEPLVDEPVWFRALNLDRNGDPEIYVQVSVRMKNGDRYVGDLHSYPILPDSEKSKDIRLGRSVLYPNSSDSDDPIVLPFDDYEGGGVLLNTVNVSSIEYILHEGYDDEDGATD